MVLVWFSLTIVTNSVSIAIMRQSTGLVTRLERRGEEGLDCPLTSRVLFAVLYPPLAVLCPTGWLLRFDWEEAGLDMEVVAVLCLYLPLLPLVEVEHCWEQIVASDVREILE